MNGPRAPLSLLKQGARFVAFGNPLYNFTLSGRAPTALAVVPSDPWPGTVTAGAQLIDGQYRFGGERIRSDDPQWRPNGAGAAWLQAAHSFDWLRDLRAVGGDAGRRHARMLVSSWLDRNGTWNAVSWEPEILGTRIANWIGLHDFYCASADDDFRSRVFDSLFRQATHLGRILPGNLSGSAMIAAVKGLVYATLCLPLNGKPLTLALRIIERELPRQLLADGIHIERNPTAHLRVLRHLVDLRAVFRAAQADMPELIQHAIDRMTPALKFFRHGDGGLALFNGSQEQEPLLIDTVLAQADARGRPIRSAPYSGFERVLAGRTLLLVDTGRPPQTPLDRIAHAGPLSFEFSIGRERLIVNCGHHPSQIGPWRRALAATAAHSTVTVGETNAAEVLENGGIGRRPTTVTCERLETFGATLIEASHDGYRRNFGITHRRRLYISENGEDLRGEDILEGPADRPFTVRFHLHPAIAVSLLPDDQGAALVLSNGATWRLRSNVGQLEIDDSIYLGFGDIPEPTHQIIISGITRSGTTPIKWALRRDQQPDQDPI